MLRHRLCWLFCPLAGRIWHFYASVDSDGEDDGEGDADAMDVDEYNVLASQDL